MSNDHLHRTIAIPSPRPLASQRLTAHSCGLSTSLPSLGKGWFSEYSWEPRWKPAMVGFIITGK